MPTKEEKNNQEEILPFIVEDDDSSDLYNSVDEILKRAEKWKKKREKKTDENFPEEDVPEKNSDVKKKPCSSRKSSAKSDIRETNEKKKLYRQKIYVELSEEDRVNLVMLQTFFSQDEMFHDVIVKEIKKRLESEQVVSFVKQFNKKGN